MNTTTTTDQTTTAARVLLVAYVASHLLAPVAVAAGFMLGLALAGAIPLIPALLLAVGTTLAHVPHLLIGVYGTRKDRAGSRVYVGAYWTVICGAAGALIVADGTGAGTDRGMAGLLVNLALVGVLTTLVTHAKNAAELVAVNDDSTDVLLRAAANARTERLTGHWYTLGRDALGVTLIPLGALTAFALTFGPDDAAGLALAITVPVAVVRLALILAGWVRGHITRP